MWYWLAYAGGFLTAAGLVAGWQFWLKPRIEDFFNWMGRGRG